MRSVVMTALAAFVLATPARADEEKVPLDKVPKAVLEAAKKRFPKAEVVGASKETEKDKTVYEVEFKAGGKTIDVTLTPEGVITTIEQQIDAKDLPKPITTALDKKYPKATFNIVEAVYAVKDGKEALDFYEVELATADKKVFEVKLAADGTIKGEEEKKPEKKEEKKPGQCDEQKGQSGNNDEKGENKQSGFRGEQKGQHEDKDNKKGEDKKKGKKKKGEDDEKNEKGKKKGDRD